MPELIEAGISCLKIEGRLKDERYVAATTRAYREAVDNAWAARGGGAAGEAPTVSRAELAQVFARGQGEGNDGLTSGFMQGPKHQSLVVGNAPRHRGVLAGRVVAVAKAEPLTLIIETALELKRGDGVVVAGGAEASSARPEDARR